MKLPHIPKAIFISEPEALYVGTRPGSTPRMGASPPYSMPTPSLQHAPGTVRAQEWAHDTPKPFVSKGSQRITNPIAACHTPNPLCAACPAHDGHYCDRRCKHGHSIRGAESVRDFIFEWSRADAEVLSSLLYIALAVALLAASSAYTFGAVL